MAEKKHSTSVLTKVQVVLAIVAVAGVAWLGWKAVGYLEAQGYYAGMREAYASDTTSGSEHIDFASLTADYPTAVAWIHFDSADVNIDYPVLQGDDNEFYLRHNGEGEWIEPGSIFLDYRNNSLADDLHSIMYGHNMMDGSMFSDLSKYVDEDFYTDETSTFWVATPEATYYYEIFSVTIVDPYSDIYTVGYENTDVFDAFVKQVKEASLYDTGVSVSGTDRVLTLSTCQRPNRLVISAKLVERK